MKKNLLTINAFAKLCRSTARTLRVYEKLGLLTPVKRDAWNKYRLYSSDQGRVFFKIKLLQNFHIPLKEISKILKEENTQEFIHGKTQALKKEILEKEQELAFLSQFEKLYFEETDLLKLVKLESIGPFMLFGHKVTSTHYHNFPQIIQELYRFTDSLKIPRYEKLLIHYSDPDQYKPLDTGIEIGIVCKVKRLPKNLKLPGGYFFKPFPKIQAYTCTYTAPTEFSTLIYERLHALGITQKLPVENKPFDLEIGGYHAPKLNDYTITNKICFPIRLASLAQGRPVKQ